MSRGGLKEVGNISTHFGAAQREAKRNAIERANIILMFVCLEIMRRTTPATANLPADLLNIKTNYEMWMSEDAILSNVETQLCNVALLICNNSPVQAGWHLHGTLRHGATKDEIKFSQQLAFAVARQFGVNVGNVQKVENLK